MTETSSARNLRRWTAIIVIVVVLYAVLMILKPLRMPIAWAAFLAFLLQPLQRRLTRRFKNPSTAAGIITGLTPLAIIAPLLLVGFAFAQQIAQLVQQLQAHPNLWDFAAWQDEAAHPRVAQLFTWLRERFSFSAQDIHDQLSGGITATAKSLAAASGQIFLNMAGTVLQFFLMLFILFFMLRDGKAWFERAVALLPMRSNSRAALFDRLGKVTRAVVYGCGLTAGVQGLLVGIGFAMAGLPGPVVFGVMAGLFALLPFGGAALVWVPATLYLYATGHVGWGTFMLAWGALVSISDNFIRPVIISRYTPVPTLLVFLGVVGGVSAFGPIGFIFGPVILVLATELLRFAEESLARRD
jgi:predicted PurR-regulated permease PerM